MPLEQDRQISETVNREQSRLRTFIRRRVPDPRDAVLGGGVVRFLWNWLVPSIFGWRPITFWEALGMLALSRILFGGLGRGGGPATSIRRRMGENWQRMTPEERDRFRQRMRERWGFSGKESDAPGLS